MCRRIGQIARGVVIHRAGLALSTTSVSAKPLRELGVGLAALDLPDYRGSDIRHTYGLPYPYFVYRGERLTVDREGLRARLFDWNPLEFDLSWAGNFALQARDNPNRRGMSTLYPLLEAGSEIDYRLALPSSASRCAVDLRLAARTAVAVGGGSVRSQGWTVSPYLQLRNENSMQSGWDARSSLGAQYGSARYHQYQYGVRRSESLAKRRAFRAQAGYSGAFVQIGTSRQFQSLWVGAFARFDALNGAAFIDSPVVNRGNAMSAGVSVSFTLWKSVRPAP